MYYFQTKLVNVMLNESASTLLSQLFNIYFGSLDKSSVRVHGRAL